jgi:putative nucleotidyltransferase with HDIG domain
MSRTKVLGLGTNIAVVVGIAVVIEVTGGLPSQLAHLYYLPVVLAALLLPLRLSFIVALLAAAAVSPLSDVIHRPLGLHVYYSNPVPWNFTPSGWVLRPLAFVAISVLTARFTQERAEKAAAQSTSAVRGSELNVLSRIDKMILAGAGEQEAYDEITKLVRRVTGCKHAGVVVPDVGAARVRAADGQLREDERAALLDERLPAGQGVSGWAMLHGKVATASNVFEDPRCDDMHELIKRLGVVSAAAVPIALDDEILGALSIAFEQERSFPPEELEMLQRIADQTAIAVASARQREALRQLAQETAIVLAEAIESRDPYTGGHCRNLAEYATQTAEALGLGRRELEVVRLGAALHDVGKIVVPDEILKKPAKLTPDEYAVIKQHCYSGGQICKRVAFLEAAYPIVYHHHERWDGQGYPDGIAGEKIPLGARIVAVADAYDAMTGDRPYRRGLPQEEAMAILHDGAGSQWDPNLVEAFLSLRPSKLREAA